MIKHLITAITLYPFIVVKTDLDFLEPHFAVPEKQRQDIVLQTSLSKFHFTNQMSCYMVFSRYYDKFWKRNRKRTGR